MPTEPMSPAVFSILSALIEQRAGLHYGAEDRDILADKIEGPMQDAGFDSFLDYYYFLRYDDPEGRALDTLIEALVVHETYFFRELASLRVAIDHFVVPRAMRGERPRIWCAACSTGEEAVTIALLLSERGLLGQCDLVASDISNRALERARKGAHGRRSLRTEVPPQFEASFERHERGVTSDVHHRDAIDFRCMNLMDEEAVRAAGTFDLIVCRNVLIYFADDVCVRVVSSLARALTPDGALLVGVSESLLRLGTQLRCEERESAFFYVNAEGRND